MEKERIKWIDNLRGMAVILVILHHAGLAGVGRFILGFHMPLFFFITGLLYRNTKMYSRSLGGGASDILDKAGRSIFDLFDHVLAD